MLMICSVAEPVILGSSAANLWLHTSKNLNLQCDKLIDVMISNISVRC